MNIGFAENDIMLRIGMDMTGYLLRSSPSIGIHDPLKIKTTVFDDGGKKLVLIICDLLGLDHAFTCRTAAAINNDLGLPIESILIACTHTHSGPASIPLQSCGDVDEKWLADLQCNIINCVRTALSQCKPSLLSYYTGISDIGYNRIYTDKSKKAALHDSQVGILTIKNADDGRLETVIVNYGCHPVVLGYDNLLYSRDYPFYLEEALRSGLRADLNVVFANGCAGDQTPVQRASFEAAGNLGNQLAGSVIKAITQNPSLDILGRLEIKEYRVRIPMIFDATPDYFTSIRREAERNAAEPANDEPADKRSQFNRAYIKWCDKMLEKHKMNRLERSLDIRCKIIKLGGLNIAALPFEIFHDIGLEIKKVFGENNTMVIGYADGNFGYLPSKSQYNDSTYEVPSAHRFYGYPGPVCRDAEYLIYQELKKGL